MIKNGWYTTMLNAKGSGLTRIISTTDSKSWDLPKNSIVECVWWHQRGIIDFEFLNWHFKLNADLYVYQLQLVHQCLIEKRPALINMKNVVLLHDNAGPHTIRVTVREFVENFLHRNFSNSTPNASTSYLIKLF